MFVGVQRLVEPTIHCIPLIKDLTPGKDIDTSLFIRQTIGDFGEG